MSLFSVLCKQSIRRELRCKSMKKSNRESLKVDDVSKMRRLVFCLVICSLVIVINSVFSESFYRWNELINPQDVKEETLRLNRYGLSWSPSDITVTFKKDVANITSGFRQGRAIESKSAPATPTPITAKAQPNDSLGRELSASGNELWCVLLDALTSSMKSDFFTVPTKHFHSWFATDEDSDESSINYDRHKDKDKDHKRKKKHKKKKHKRKYKMRKKYKKFLLPLLIAYKLKFFALIPVFIGKMIFLIKLKLLKLVVGAVLSFLKLLWELLRYKKRRFGKRKGIRRVHHQDGHGIHILSHVTWLIRN